MKLVYRTWKGVWPGSVLVMFMIFVTGFSTNSSLVTGVKWLPETPRQGDVVHIVVETAVKGVQVQAQFLEQDLAFFSLPSDNKGYHAIGGVDYSQIPGTYELIIRAQKGEDREETIKVQITVHARQFPEERLTLPEDMVVLSPGNQRRVQKEQDKISSLFAMISPERFWHGAFWIPAKGKFGSPFGIKRIINQKPRNPHTGQDIKAQEGTPVVASNQGKVVMIGDFFFGGNSVFIDHGEGVYTMYLHLSGIRVREEEFVKRGDVLGWVGSTGRALGPHLHWGVRIRGARVDPLVLVKITEPLVE